MPPLSAGLATRPRFSIVIAIDHGEPSLDAFTAMIEAQRFDSARIEIVAVYQGPTDGSIEHLEDPAAGRTRRLVRLQVLSGGLDQGRNRGLDNAAGDWVMFAVPGDALDPNFFRVADRFATAHPDVVLLAPRPVPWAARHGHQWGAPVGSTEYDRGDCRVDLVDEPERFPGVGPGELYRSDRIKAAGLRFEAGIGPEFLEAHFAARYLLAVDRPVLGILRSARYLERGPASGDDPASLSRRDPACRADVLPTGLRGVMDQARGRDGFVAPWLQHLVIDEVARYLEGDDTITTSIHIPVDLLPAFHDVLGSVVAELDPAVVAAHGARALRSVWADILAHACRPTPWRSAAVARTKVDRDAGLQRVSYRYTGPAPREAFFVDGQVVEPVAGKTMGHIYYGRALLWERIAWVPIGSLEVRLDEEHRPIVSGWSDPRSLVRPTSPAGWLRLYRTTPARRLIRGLARRAAIAGYRVAATPIRLIARLPRYRSTFRDAWVLMDRVFNADDNGERLFEFLRAERPDINAWFVLERGNPDWDRLETAGESRLIAYGSFRWLMLMLHCAWVVSSHGSRAVATPPKVTHISGKPTWRYAFLQHGVMKDDLSKWMNRRDMDLFVVSTQAELASVVSDGTGYRYTSREARNTGLPRFDRLLAKGRAVPPEERDLVIVAPTWRMWLTDGPDQRMDRPVHDAAFWTSDYLHSWLAVLGSPEIAAAAARHHRRIAFMPHPNMQVMLPRIDLPPHVQALAFEGNDVQALYARCALLVTDYSSVAFNAAILDRPVVYFQFDHDVVMAGAHLGRKGYFEYERDGFGPVVTDLGAAVAAIVRAIERGPTPPPEYQARIDRTFLNRDGRACARVVAAIEAVTRPYGQEPPRPRAAAAGGAPGATRTHGG